MDPLSQLISLLKPQSVISRGFELPATTAIRWPEHVGIKCYAVITGQCFLAVQGVQEGIVLSAGDCFLLPPGPPFSLAKDPGAKQIDFMELREQWLTNESVPTANPDSCFLFGGHFFLSGSHAELLLQSLPPIVHIRKESEKATMRWSLERLKEEVLAPQPGSSLMSQQLVCMILVQALRLHVAGDDSMKKGWLAALADKQLGVALACIHDHPEQAWTLQALAEQVGMSRSVFALRFREVVGMTPIDYLTRWRMLLASDRMENTSDSLAAIASSLGYESESAFGKAFKRMMGHSPRRYGIAALTQTAKLA